MTKSLMILGAGGNVGRTFLWISLRQCELWEDFPEKIHACDVKAPPAGFRKQLLSSLHGSAVEWHIRQTRTPEDLRALLREIRPELVVNCLPGTAGRDFARTCLEEGICCVDVSFFEEEFQELAGLVEEKGVFWWVDCGIAPGLSHLVLQEWNARRTCPVRSWKCFTGGFPAKLQGPWYYQPLFACEDVMAEYERPARFLRKRKIQQVDPLAEIRPTFLFSREWGKLCAFRTDGVRTLLFSNLVEDAEEWTLRPCEHLMKVREALKQGISLREIFQAMNRKGARQHLSREEIFLLYCEGEDAEGNREWFRLIAHSPESPEKEFAGGTLLGWLTGVVLSYTVVYAWNRMHKGTVKPGIWGPEVLPDGRNIFQDVIVFFQKHPWIQIQSS